MQARIVTPEGAEVTGYDEPGELLVKSDSVVQGYLNNPEATRETFQDGWLRTGDEAVVRKSPQGNEHVWIVDRIKEYFLLFLLLSIRPFSSPHILLANISALLDSSRSKAYKSRPPSWKHTCSHTPAWPTAP